MKMNKRPLLTCVVALAAAMLFAACGDKEPAAKSAPPAASTAAPSESGAALTPDRSITVTANDQMKFNLSEIKASPGEVLSITLENAGTMPKFSMGHNLVVLQPGVDTQQFCEAAMTEAAHDYLPPAMKSSIVAATKLLGGGESDTIVFRVPEKAGDYPFICSFPGHYQVGMRGVIAVH